MGFHKDQLLVRAVADRAWTGGRGLCERAEKALKGGVTIVQFREESLEKKNFDQVLGEAEALRELMRGCHVPLIIDDNMDLAEAYNADGLHVGQDDMDTQAARRILGPDQTLRVTAKTVEQALRAQAQGTDYLGSGAVFGTTTKADARPMIMEAPRGICNSVDIPVIAVRGINLGNIGQLSDSHVAGAAVISGISAIKDICGATQCLAEEMKKSLNLLPKTANGSK